MLYYIYIPLHAIVNAEIYHARIYSVLFSLQETHFYAEEHPKVQCDYLSHDKCTGYQPKSCCDRIREVSPSPSGVTHVTAEVLIIMILFIMAAGFV